MTKESKISFNKDSYGNYIISQGQDCNKKHNMIHFQLDTSDLDILNRLRRQIKKEKILTCLNDKSLKDDLMYGLDYEYKRCFFSDEKTKGYIQYKMENDLKKTDKKYGYSVEFDDNSFHKFQYLKECYNMDDRMLCVYLLNSGITHKLNLFKIKSKQDLKCEKRKSKRGKRSQNRYRKNGLTVDIHFGYDEFTQFFFVKDYHKILRTFTHDLLQEMVLNIDMYPETVDISEFEEWKKFDRKDIESLQGRRLKHRELRFNVDEMNNVKRIQNFYNISKKEDTLKFLYWKEYNRLIQENIEIV